MHRHRLLSVCLTGGWPGAGPVVAGDESSD
ncbi:hypothetical protein JOE57_000333 [Microlunatus panaciterrae]|uniref:Uncharacterized protein n=1 Tax=Microlunatus panaciterrae TaxID=400768 RepID=A0ABS2RFV8_9ACTN|nr:hypothetical protein [Microlunatus panaciterrae]